MMNFNALPEFDREFKRLSKKYKSLYDDLEVFKAIVSALPLGNSRHFACLAQIKKLTIVKARFFCKYLRGNSLRIIYAYWKETQTIEFIEVYFKGENENEDSQRIKEYIKARISER